MLDSVELKDSVVVNGTGCLAYLVWVQIWLPDTEPEYSRRHCEVGTTEAVASFNVGESTICDLFPIEIEIEIYLRWIF